MGRRVAEHLEGKARDGAGYSQNVARGGRAGAWEKGRGGWICFDVCEGGLGSWLGSPQWLPAAGGLAEMTDQLAGWLDGWLGLQLISIRLITL